MSVDAGQARVLDALQPYIDDLTWRKERGARRAAADIAIAVLLGLHGCRDDYSDPFVNLDETGDELAVRVRDVLAPGGKISYTYDLGASWEHEITLEKVMPRDPGQDYPVCVAYTGDSPVEYWSEDDPEEPEPFNLAEVNRKLAALGEAGEITWHFQPATTTSRPSPPSSSAARN